MTRRYVFACTLVLVLGSACADGSPGVAGDASTSTPATDAASVGQPSEQSENDAEGPGVGRSGSVCAAEVAAASYEEAARCAYDALLTDNRELAAHYATPRAVAELFELSGPDTAEWRYEGCDQQGESSSSSGVICHYYVPAEVHGVHVEMAMSADMLVEDVTTIG